jgi:hypothetical protein
MSTPPDWTRYLRHLETCLIFGSAPNNRCDCGMLKAEGREMDRIHRFQEALRKIGSYTAAHQNVIDARWVAKVIDEAMTPEGN